MTVDDDIAALPGAKRIARNTTWNIVGMCAPILVALYCIPQMIRGLGQDQFGLLSLVWMLVGYFTILDMGIGRALTRIAAERIGQGPSRIFLPFSDILHDHVGDGNSGRDRHVGHCAVADHVGPAHPGCHARGDNSLVPRRRTGHASRCHDRRHDRHAGGRPAVRAYQRRARAKSAVHLHRALTGPAILEAPVSCGNHTASRPSCGMADLLLSLPP